MNPQLIMSSRIEEQPRQCAK